MVRTGEVGVAFAVSVCVCVCVRACMCVRNELRSHGIASLLQRKHRHFGAAGKIMTNNLKNKT